MIHPINKLPQAECYLRDILDLQVAVLEAFVNVPGDIPKDLKEKKGVEKKNKLKPILQEYLSQEYLRGHPKFKNKFKDRSEDIASWIVGKGKPKITLLDPLIEFANASYLEKCAFIKGVKYDIDLLFSPEGKKGTLRAIPKQPPPWQKGAKDFLYRFYDIWEDTGFDPCLFPCERTKNRNYYRSDMVKEFIERNPELYVCAICDGASYKTQVKGKAYTSIEHFFPRSIYPHLSCHPYNLIPICSSCNSFIKGSEDPLSEGDDGINWTLDDLPLPYQDFSFREESVIAVVERAQTEKHPHELKMKPARGKNSEKKIKAINRLYKVDERWSENIDQIEEQAFRRLRQFLTVSESYPKCSDDAVTHLRKLMAITDMENLGKDPFAFPVVWILKYFADEIIKAEEDNDNTNKLAICKELNNWREKLSNKRLKEIEDRIDKIYNRVPN